MAPHVELLFWDGCPSHPKALADLREALGELGLDPGSVALTAVPTQADAEREVFCGSPTIRIDGRDIVESGAEPVALACRVYTRRDGSISPVPDPADVRDALRAALARRPPGAPR